MSSMLRWLYAGVIGIAVAHSATAGTFSISPMRIELDRKHSVEVLTIHNDEDAPLLVQAQIVAWTQENNEDKTAASKDLLVTPPVFQVPPKSEQIVRVALRHTEVADYELHYRLILSEVPPPKQENFVGLSVALRMSIPIFIAPEKSISPDLKWMATWQSNDLVQIEAINQGKAHLQVNDFEVQFGDSGSTHANVSRYVLPGSRIVWNIKPPANADRKAVLSIHGYSDQGEFHTAVGNAEIQ
jgi:fimbrial chaperone protein